MAKLSDIGPPGGGGGSCTCSDPLIPICPVHGVKKKPIRLADTVASPLFAPEAWQTAAPDDLFTRGTPIGRSADLERILALPRRAPVDLDSPTAEAIVELEMAKYAIDNPNCKCKEIAPGRQCITRLLPIQAVALREISLAQGLLANIAVGAGKTCLSLLSTLALTNVKQCLLLIPAPLLDQIERDYRLFSQHFKVPGIIVHGSKSKNPLRKPIEGLPTLHVLAYTRLSLPTSSDWIKNLSPDAIIADECDSIKSMISSRTMRVFSFFAGDSTMTAEERDKRRRTKFLGWTGTLTDHSLKEFSHLSLLALKDRSPLPLDPQVVEEWSRCIDATESPCPPGALLDLAEPGEDVRHAVRRRMAETLGFIVQGGENVITALGSSERVELQIQEKEAPPLPAIVEKALDMVRQGVRPDTLAPDGKSQDDEELEDQMAIARCAQEISTGMFYRWIFPRGEKVDLIKEWLRRRKLWNKELRLKSQQGETYLDSALLCEQAARRAWGDSEEREDRPNWKADAWPEWRDIKDLVKPESQAVRLDDFLAQDAAQWGLENKGIIWYRMREFGYWVHEISKLPIHDGGPKGGERLMAERGDRSIISSISSNARGRDGLQYLFDHQLIANVPSSATVTEQLLGRMHRRGQKSVQVLTEVYLHTDELVKSFDQALRRSEYVQAILKSEQKLLRGFRRR